LDIARKGAQDSIQAKHTLSAELVSIRHALNMGSHATPGQTLATLQKRLQEDEAKWLRASRDADAHSQANENAQRAFRDLHRENEQLKRKAGELQSEVTRVVHAALYAHNTKLEEENKQLKSPHIAEMISIRACLQLDAWMPEGETLKALQNEIARLQRSVVDAQLAHENVLNSVKNVLRNEGAL
jgi:predicted  nucleic acid-binding Zn-ribbon protein